MLSYRHHFHAGNHADVLKHLVLTFILQSLTAKEKPLFFLDTHSGQGIYPLSNRQTQMHAEYQQGILRLWESASVPALIEPYLQIVRAFNDNKLTVYPGSPTIASYLLREQDRLLLCELHPRDADILAEHFQADRRVNVLHSDGYAQIKANMPPASRRGVIFVDPSYELKNEASHMAKAVWEGYKRFATGVFCIWYPVLRNRSILEPILREWKHKNISKLLQIELSVAETLPVQMIGSGLLIINPPWQLDSQMNSVLRWLLSCLACGDKANYKVKWLSNN